MMYNYQTAGDKLRIFHKKMQEELGDPPGGRHLISLRNVLIGEEYIETRDALYELYAMVQQEDNHIATPPTNEKELRAHLLKEICDLVYVAVGTAEQLGLNFDTAFNIVHKDNMSKLENPRVNSDGKLMKPVGYKAPDLSEFV
jgi:predicted HAD superfamily Cof-like phosphohydrolase